MEDNNILNMDNDDEDIVLEQAMSNHLIVASILKYLPPADVKSARFLNTTWNSTALSAMPPKLRLNLGKVLRSEDNSQNQSQGGISTAIAPAGGGGGQSGDCNLLSDEDDMSLFDPRLAKQLTISISRLPSNPFLSNFSHAVESLIITTEKNWRRNLILEETGISKSIFFRPLFTGNLKQLKSLEIQHISGFSNQDLLKLFDQKLLPNLRVLGLGQDFDSRRDQHGLVDSAQIDELLEMAESQGFVQGGITCVKLVWINWTSFERIGTIFPSMKGLEIGVMVATRQDRGRIGLKSIRELVDAICFQFMNRARKEEGLRHLHLHVIEMYNDSDWGGVVAMMMERKDILGDLETLTFEADRGGTLNLRTALDPVEIEEIKSNFGCLSEIRFTNFVWPEDEAETENIDPIPVPVIKPRLIFDIKVPDSLNLTIMSRSDTKVKARFTLLTYENCRKEEYYSSDCDLFKVESFESYLQEKAVRKKVDKLAKKVDAIRRKVSTIGAGRWRGIISVRSTESEGEVVEKGIGKITKHLEKRIRDSHTKQLKLLCTLKEREMKEIKKYLGASLKDECIRISKLTRDKAERTLLKGEVAQVLVARCIAERKMVVKNFAEIEAKLVTDYEVVEEELERWSGERPVGFLRDVGSEE